ncbi:MAG TPA: LEPR-XLL domain-containing protein, partial [Terriglobia bacterium]|nr:LEPR-XLL domain-containing protein [Terriglobia bacterium]
MLRRTVGKLVERWRSRTGLGIPDRFLVEPLEPRLLLSADLLPSADAVAPVVTPAVSPIVEEQSQPPLIAPASLAQLFDEALGQLERSGFDTRLIAEAGAATDVSIVDLPGWTLGEVSNGGIQIDWNAAGNGWFVDDTPGDNSEFDQDGRAIAGGPADGRIDLLTVLTHELGHLLGLTHTDAEQPDGSMAFMQSGIRPGIRRLPGSTFSLTDQLVETLRSAHGPPDSQNLTIVPTITYIADVDGWDDPANWLDSLGASRLPTSADDVLIDRPGVDLTLTIGAGAQVHSLVSTESILLTGGVFSVGSDAEIGGDFRISGGTLILNGVISVSGTLLQTGGSVTGKGSIQADGRIIGVITVSGERDTYTFDLAAPTRLHFDSFTNNGNLNWSLTGPAGTHVSGRGFNNSDSFDFGSPILSLPAGSYTLTVDGSGDATGTYSFRLLDLADAVVITPGTPVNGTLRPATESDLYQFDALAGEQYFFDIQTGIGNATWRLFDPFNNLIFSTNFNTDNELSAFSRTGTYTLIIEGRVDSGTGTAGYTFNVKPVPSPVTAAIQPGDTVNGAITVSGERDVYTFALAGTSRLHFDSFTNTNNLTWSLSGPAGTHVSGRQFNNSDSFDFSSPILTLPAGNYTLTVDGSGDSTGSYSFRLLDLSSAAVITPGTAVTATLSPATESDLYQFDALAGERYFFDVQSGISNATWRLFDPFSNLVFNTNFNTDNEPSTFTLSGTYTLIIEGRVDSGTGTTGYTFNVKPVPAPVTTGIQLGDTVNGAITVSGERDVYSFTLGGTAKLHFDSLTNTNTLDWSLSGPAGTHVSGRSFSNSDSFDFSSPSLALPAGAYTLTVDGSGDATGAYSFRLLNLADAAPITPGTPASGSLDPATESDLYSFAALAGDQFLFDVTTGIGNATWRLIDPFNNTLFSTNFNSDVSTLTLANTGTYVLILEGRVNSGTGAANYTFNVSPQGNQPPQPFTGTPLTLGATVSDTISVAGEVDSYIFTLAGVTRVHFDSQTNNNNFNWSLVGPAGTHVGSRSFTGSDSFDFGSPLLSLPAGDYRLTVAGSNNATGAYTFRLLDAASATPLTPGTPVSSSLNPATETDLYQFDGVAGERYYFDALTGLSNATWRLVDLFNNVVFSDSQNSDIDAFTLPRTGTYILAIEGRFNAGAGTANYSFNVQPVAPAIDTPINLNDTVTGAISVTGETDVFTFTLATATRVHFDSQTNNNNINWTLTGPAGTFVNRRSFTGSDSFDFGSPLMTLGAGDYRLSVDANSDTTGSYAFRLLDAASAVPLTPGTMVSGSLSPATETDLYQFDGVAGERYYFDALTGLNNATWRLVDLFNNVVFSDSQNTDIDTFTLPRTGTYILAIEGRFNAGAGTANYSFNVQPVAPAIDTPINLNDTVTSAISVTGETDVFTFTLATTTRVHFDSQTNNNSINWTLTGPAGTFVNRRTFTGSDSFDFGSPLMTLGAGDYRLSVDANGDTTGSYAFRLLDAASAVPLTPGTMVSGSLSPATETDLYQFDGVAGERYYFDALTGLNNATWRLVDLFNNVVFSDSQNTDIDTFTLPRTGTYILAIEGRFNAGAGTANYSFNVQPVVPVVDTPINLNDTVTSA